ncbi:GTPase HflX [Petralouisia muris]|uniref:GTPase HflX n=1 Tax=Petralouisia muris TaxID=3032872 RepID=A0AC61RZY4_9FIRM|nr:GTPase HflX [Petralouisia muris]TGY97753.1 GTPase HflX [Petralouisia muris]
MDEKSGEKEDYRIIETKRNTEPFQIEEVTEQVILAGVSFQENDDTEASLLELAELAETAGAKVLGSVIQSREHIHPGTYLGTGKLQELRQMAAELGATGIVCDDELSPAQLRNMEQELECKVMDRTLLILDIFAARASTSEGKIQVELAQLKYRMTRLTGLGLSLSRLGGGIGTRGPGEKKLEMDRRLIKNRIAQLNRELKQVKKHREINRGQREKNRMKVAAIVGYTNAGKSTLLNRLTHASVLEEDKLFATLDPTTRSLKLESGQEVLLTDTVGFIRKLPHHLIQAFGSTLEEAKYADIIIHVIDASNPQWEKQMQIVYETLEHLGVSGKKRITLWNKQDKVTEKELFKDPQADRMFQISAKTGEGLKEFLEALEEILREDKQLLEGIFSYEKGNRISAIRKYGELLQEEYREEGIYVKAYVPAELYPNLEVDMSKIREQGLQ